MKRHVCLQGWLYRVLFFAIIALMPGLIGGIGLLYSRSWAKQALF